MTTTTLPRKLGLRDAVFLLIGSVFGSGIFMTSGLMAADCPSPFHLLLAWLLGGAITLLGALTFAELGTMFPGAGGPYVYLREAYGKLPAFLYGWGFFWIVGCGGVAALGAALIESLAPFIPVLAAGRILFRIGPAGCSLAVTLPRLLAAVAVVVVSGLNLAGLRTGMRFQNALVVLRLAVLIVFIAAGFAVALAPGSVFSLGRAFRPAPVGWAGFGAALLAVLWTYDGWYSVTCTAEEIRRPGRVLPAALGLGTLAVTILYVLSNIVYNLAVPLAEMRGVVRIGETAARRLFGPAAAAGFAGLVAVSVLGCLSANILFCARVPFAMARDGLFWPSLGRVHPRTALPSRAMSVQMVVAASLCLTGGFQRLYEFVVFALTVFFAATAMAVPWLRRRRPELARPYRTWGYPLVPALFALVNLAVFALSASTRPGLAASSAGVLLVGLPAYFVWMRRLARRPSAARGISSGGIA
jgi:basic amino acid/polyamine antiporter, APA family